MPAATITQDEIQRALEPQKAIIEERVASRAQWLAQKEKWTARYLANWRYTQSYRAKQ